jgi:hypothetical protein
MKDGLNIKEDDINKMVSGYRDMAKGQNEVNDATQRGSQVQEEYSKKLNNG